jgi:DNA-binding HxlR family transcriptional regulator
MYEYEEFCPISKTASILGEKWTVQIVREMHFGVTRFSEFMRFMPRISPTLLNTRLQSLEKNGVIYRRKIREQRGYEYLLTPSGKAMLPIILEMGKWGVSFVYDSLSDNELNAERLVRDISTTIDPAALPSGDTVVRWKFTDLAETPYWYIKIHEGKGEVCEGAPEIEVDVYFTCSLMTFTEIWMGSRNLQAAIDNNELEVIGDSVYTRNLTKWLGLNVYAKYNPKFRSDASDR